MKGHDLQAGRSRPVSVARAAATALGEDHHGQAPPRRQLEHPILFLVVLHPLRTREYGVVVRHDHAPGLGLVEEMSIDPADPRNQPIGWGAFNQIF